MFFFVFFFTAGQMSGWNKRGFRFVLLGKWQGGIRLRGLGFVQWGNGRLE